MSKTTITDYSVGAWFAVAIIGQLAFFTFIAVFYAWPAMLGDVTAWNRNVILAQPPVDPDYPVATIAFGVHAIGASIISLMGGLQLMPFVRNRFRRFHRWNGRIFLFTVFALAVSGYYLTWMRGDPPDQLSEFGTSVNGVLIFSFGAMALATALRKRFDLHEKWAVRLFLVSNQQWLFRIGAFLYFAASQALGREVSLTDPFFAFWVWGCFIIPLAMAELYFATRRAARAWQRWASASLFVLAIPLTAGGIFVFTMFTVQLVTGAVGAG